MTYAAGTTVTVERSQQEIAATLTRYDVDTYTFGARPGRAVVEFVLADMPIRLAIPLPAKPAQQKGRNPATGRTVDLHKAWEQEVREAWRALLLFLKANLEAVERGVITAEQAFMAFLLTPDGRTVGDAVLPAYRQALTSGRLAIEASA